MNPSTGPETGGSLQQSFSQLAVNARDWRTQPRSSFPTKAELSASAAVWTPLLEHSQILHL